MCTHDMASYGDFVAKKQIRKKQSGLLVFLSRLCLHMLLLSLLFCSVLFFPSDYK